MLIKTWTRTEDYDSLPNALMHIEQMEEAEWAVRQLTVVTPGSIRAIVVYERSETCGNCGAQEDFHNG